MKKMSLTLDSLLTPETKLSDEEPIQALYDYRGRRGGAVRDMHYGLELGLVCQGRLQRHYRDHRRTIGPGQVWFCGMWEPHGLEILDAPCEYVILIAWPSMVARLHFEEAADVQWMAPFILPPARRPQTTPTQRNQMLAIGQELKGMIRQRERYHVLRLRLILIRILLLMFERWNPGELKADNKPVDLSGRLNRAVQTAIESRCYLSTTRVAAACGLNRNSLGRLFRSWMGMHFNEFALRHRLHSAAQELIRTPLPVKSIASSWGFTDSSHFDRQFVRYYGCTPQQYRALPDPTKPANRQPKRRT